MNETGKPIAPAELPPDRPLVIYDILEEIAGLIAAGTDPSEVEPLVEEFRRLRAEL